MNNSPDYRKAFGTIRTTDSEFKEVQKLVYNNLGINLTEKKRSLVESRLQRTIKSLGLSSFRQYLNYIKNDTTGQAFGELSNRISTNHTFFFREEEHFKHLTSTVLPKISESFKGVGAKQIRMWCAGCSFGDEPYSFAISMMEFFGSDYASWDIGLLATDISLAALEGAQEGIYPEERLKLVPSILKRKYFIKQPDGYWRISNFLRAAITLRMLNFMNRDFPFKKKFHIISCRNVMIYFDQPTRDELIKKFYKYTEPGGYLYIGHSETISRDNSLYQYIQPAIYQKVAD